MHKNAILITLLFIYINSKQIVDKGIIIWYNIQVAIK